MTALLPALAQRLAEVEIDLARRRAAVGERMLVAQSHRHLRTMLSGALYESWHAGRTAREEPAPKPARDHAFEEALQAAVPHDNSLVDAVVEPLLRDAESVVVWLRGIRVRVPAGRVVAVGDGDAVRVRLPSVLPAVSPGFLMVGGSCGTGTRVGSWLRVYLHLPTPDAAPVVWGAVLNRLEARGVAYRAKVASLRTVFPRRDAMVVYLGPDSWGAANDVRGAAVATGGLASGVSAFAHRLDAGVSIAWEPDDPRPGMRGLSFGEHRSRAIAAGLVAAWMDQASDRHAVVAETLVAAGIDPHRPFRNVTSPELPGR